MGQTKNSKYLWTNFFMKVVFVPLDSSYNAVIHGLIYLVSLVWISYLMLLRPAQDEAPPATLAPNDIISTWCQLCIQDHFGSIFIQREWQSIFIYVNEHNRLEFLSHLLSVQLHCGICQSLIWQVKRICDICVLCESLFEQIKASWSSEIY